MPHSRRRPIALVVVLLAAAGFASPFGAQAQVPAELPFRNPDLPVEKRIDDLLGRLTLDEKVSLMIERAAPVDRLGIPRFPWWNEALHGVARTGRATVFPQAIALAAAWDTDLMLRVATGISDEARAMNNTWVARDKRNLYQGLVFWSPNINIVRDPRWGRGQETYGEDPFLTGAIGTAFVMGMQGTDPRYLKTVATAKHYAVHSGPESLRHTFDARVSESDLRETYLPAFRDLVVNGKAESVMCSYNSFRGQPACGNDELLGKVLRKEWGFGGYVVSDCGAVIDIHESHKARKTAAEGAAMALLAGTDLECGAGSWIPGAPDSFQALGDAVKQGLVKESDLDQALRRLFRAQVKLGVYDPPQRLPWAGYTYETIVSSPKHQQLALEAARKSIVLLKNENAALPLKKGLRSIAVIGPSADEAEVLSGNYNGTPVAPVTVLAGIRAAAEPGTKVTFARGGPLATGLPDLHVVPGSALSTDTHAGRKPGLMGFYYSGQFDDGPVLERLDPVVDFDWADRSPSPLLGDDSFSVRWTGAITAPTTGRTTLGVRCATACRLFLDGKPVAQGRSDHEPVTITGVVSMRAGVPYPIRLEMEHEKYDAIAQLLWETPGGRGDEVAEAVAAAQGADAVVMVLGLSSRLEGEEMPVRIEGFAGGDRTSLDLPKVQQQLMEKVVAAAKGKPVVLVLQNGSALSIGWADANVPAIVEAWYGGQAGGTAVGDVLFGNVSPAGRLPLTFYRSVDELPPFDDYAMKGRTYRYFTGAPLYPFGHGLSYSRFAYAKLVVPKKAVVGAPVALAVEVQNAGAVASDEVVQLYVTDAEASGPVPLRALKGFQRVSLKPGEKRVVRFTLDERALSLVGPDGQRVVEPGRFTIAVGGKQPGL
ncbi:MAG TPA: glycoside hydrolase family 3 C-terminal domain-containing protein, partial [Vicinamibacteria bacterium]|nr:glycoside hydrolase family 3 C-terminal domain-containing protein [Vicinamibacteria bacterium]